MAKGKDPGWWDDFFPDFRPVFAIMSERGTTNGDVKLILKKLNLRPGMKFLDCPCGIGRVSLPLARAGIKVRGVDITSSYLEEFRAKARRSGLKIDLHRMDMRRINFDREFDAAANLWTSFGYFEKESDNLLVLKKMFKALKPGGKFLLHIINRDWVMANFRSSDWYEAGKMKVLEKRGFDFARSVGTATWTFIGPHGTSSHDTSIRLYSYHELIGMFKKVGFVDIEGYGSNKEEPIAISRNYMYIFGTRPK
ncbi:MAG: methyltransferase domain-containing protein [Candidatus Zixiibacteriota bacterium]